MSFDCQFQQWHTLNMRLVKWRGNMVPILMISKVFLVSIEPPPSSSSYDNSHNHHYHGLTPKKRHAKRTCLVCPNGTALTLGSNAKKDIYF